MTPDCYIQMRNTEDTHWWFTARRDILSSVIKRHLKAMNPAIMEIGCGTGGNLEMLSRHGAVCAVESNSLAVELVKKRFEDRFPLTRCELPHLLGVQANSVDLVCLFDVIEHITNDAGALNGALAPLRAGGLAIITVPAHPWLWSQHDVMLGHKRRYTLKSITSLATSTGLEVEHATHFNTLLFPLIIAARILDSRSKKKRDVGTETPPAILNAILRSIFRSERLVVPRLTLPFGSSLLVVARKPSTRRT